MRYIQVHYILSIAYIYNHIYIYTHVCLHILCRSSHETGHFPGRPSGGAHMAPGLCRVRLLPSHRPWGPGPWTGRDGWNDVWDTFGSSKNDLEKKKSGEMCLRNRNWGHNFMFWNCGSVWSCWWWYAACYKIVPLLRAAQDDVIENAYATAQKFFQLPFEEKSRCDTGKEYGAPWLHFQSDQKIERHKHHVSDGLSLVQES